MGLGTCPKKDPSKRNACFRKSASHGSPAKKNGRCEQPQNRQNVENCKLVSAGIPWRVDDEHARNLDLPTCVVLPFRTPCELHL
eukprot:3755098-Amphidinium_carterae.1